MTVIVGLVERDGTVYIGGDSAAVEGTSVYVRTDEKVFRNGPLLMGFCGSFRIGQVLRYGFRPPPIEESLDRYIRTTFITAVREALVTHGTPEPGAATPMRREDDIPGWLLIGVAGRLYRIDEDYHAGEFEDGWTAVGVGAPYALGAMLSTAGLLPPKVRLRRALEAAGHYCSGVCGPFKIKHLRS